MGPSTVELVAVASLFDEIGLVFQLLLPMYVNHCILMTLIIPVIDLVGYNLMVNPNYVRILVTVAQDVRLFVMDTMTWIEEMSSKY